MSWHYQRIKLDLEIRQESSSRILKRFPGRVPIIVDHIQNDTSTFYFGGLRRHREVGGIDHNGNSGLASAALDGEINPNLRHKFLVPYDCSLGQFQWILRNKFNLSPSKAIFLVVNRTLPHASCLIGELYRDYHDPDGFLYIHYSGENTFGT